MFWWVCGGLASLITVVVIVGSLLPKNHIAVCRIHLAAPREVVFDLITSVRDYATWCTQVTSVQNGAPQDGFPVFVLTSRHGDMPIRVEVTDRPSRFKTRIASNKLPFGGTWTWTFEDDGRGGTILSATEDGVIHNPVFRFVARYFMGYHSTLESWLRDAATHFEETALPQRVTPS